MRRIGNNVACPITSERPFLNSEVKPALVDWSGRAQLENKRGITEGLPPILERLGFDERAWFKSMKLYQQPFAMIGAPDRIRAAAARLSRQWFRGIGEMAVWRKSEVGQFRSLRAGQARIDGACPSAFLGSPLNIGQF